MRTFSSILLTISLTWSIISGVHALGTFNNTVNLPETLKASIVRVAVDIPGGTELGTGTIIHTRQVRGGSWICILTADHLFNRMSADRLVGVGFGDGDDFPYRRHVLFRHATIDIAVLGVFIPEWALVPEWHNVQMGDARRVESVLAGYGDRAQLAQVRVGNNLVDAYEAVEEYGILRAGYDTVDILNRDVNQPINGKQYT